MLNQYYDRNSSFTLSANTLAPRIQNPGMRVPPKPWEVYYPYSRNLTRVHNATAQTNKYYKGVEDIKRCWTGLPKTFHDITKGDAWVYDIWPLEGLPSPQDPNLLVSGIIISVHGEFDEVEKVTAGKNSGLKRSFDRTFTLGPGNTPTGIRVINDMLVIRPYGGFEAWKPTPEPAAVAPGAGPTDAVKQQMVNELMRVTELNVEFAGRALEEHGWNYDACLAAFHAAKQAGTIPPEAYSRPGVI